MTQTLFGVSKTFRYQYIMFPRSYAVRAALQVLVGAVLLLCIVSSLSCAGTAPFSGESDLRVEVTRTFSTVRLSSEMLSDVFSIPWSLPSIGDVLSFNEMIATDDRSEIVFRVARALYLGDLDDPFIQRLDKSHVYFRIPPRAVYLHMPRPHVYNKNAVATVVSTTGMPIVSRDHERIAKLAQSELWKDVVLIVSRPAQ